MVPMLVSNFAISLPLPWRSFVYASRSCFVGGRTSAGGATPVWLFAGSGGVGVCVVPWFGFDGLLPLGGFLVSDFLCSQPTATVSSSTANSLLRMAPEHGA